MKSRIVLLTSCLFFSLCAGTAQAEPKNGFGLNAGLASHSSDCGGGCTLNTSGLSIGLDYQFALSENLSLNPFLMSSGEATDISGLTAGHGILGVQFRYWVGDMFFGGHVGNYTEVLTITSGSLSISGSGSGGGAGLVAGWEKPDGGLYVMGQLDSATIAGAKLSGFRLSAGYRWK